MAHRLGRRRCGLGCRSARVCGRALPALRSALADAPPPILGTGVPVPSPVAPSAPDASAAPAALLPPLAPSAAPSVSGALAAAPPPVGLVPSAVAPPPADDDTADIPVIPLRPPSSAAEAPSPSPEAPFSPATASASLASPPSIVSATAPPRLDPVPLVEPEPTLTGPTDLDRLLAGIASPTAHDDVIVAPELAEAEAASPPSPSPSAASPSAPSASGPVPVPPDPLTPAPAASSSPSAPVLAPSAPSAPTAVGSVSSGAAGTAPIAPLPPTGPPRDPAALRVEESALEPTPAALRAGRSLRLFWLWFSVSASAVSIGLGGVLLALGMSLREAILSALIGVALSFLPLGLGTLAGKWSGQPTIVVSRATFGIVGNAVPALLAVVTRLVWAAALVWMLGTGIASALGPLGLDPALTAPVAAAVGLVIAASVAGLGFGLIVRVAAVASVLAAVLLVALIALTVPRLDIPQALTIPDGGWALVVTGVVLVFSVIGLAWAQSSGDLARYQSRSTLGVGAVMGTGFGATLPAFLLVCWGALLAASDPQLASGLATDPIGALGAVLPGAGSFALVLALAISLVLAAALALYSGGFAILSAGLRAPRWGAVLAASVGAGAVLAVLAVTAPALDSLVRDGLTTLAVPVAAWAGVFGAETMMRRRRVHSPSLLRSGGVYPAVRVLNLVVLLGVTVIGWGLTAADTAGLGWQGYLWPLLGADPVLIASDLGVLVALGLGLLVPVAAGVPALRRLEAAERAAVDS